MTCATSDELYDYAPPWRDFPDIRDVGLVILDQPVNLSEYGVLAAPSSLDKLATKRGQQETTFTVSGYGLQAYKPVYVIEIVERLMAQSRVTNLRSALTDCYNIQLNGNSKDHGSGCYGDSGGAVFHGGYTSNTIVAMPGWWIGGRDDCIDVAYYYRTDRQEVIDWILQTIPQSEVNNIKIVEL